MAPRPLRITALTLIALVLSACGSPVGEDAAGAGPPDPTIGTELPEGYRLSLPRDAILPIRDPVFVPGSASEWEPERWVVGVEIDGEARAYPIGMLTVREMVIDHHRGIPTLVTW